MRDVGLWMSGEAERVYKATPPGDEPGLLQVEVRDLNPDRASYGLSIIRRAEELLAAGRRKDEFLAALSHELRSPLASIWNALALLGNESGETLARQKAQALIERQVRRMTQLVDDLLDLSRITRGQLRLRRERIDLSLAVRHAVATLEGSIDALGHRLTVVVPDDPVWLQGDPDRLEQVFVNLLANAAKYTDPGGEIFVGIEVQIDQALVRVRDSGIGMTPEGLLKIFELFRQADEADMHSRSGLGIGLALVRNFVELHGGTVSAASAGLGHGSEFTVSLPREA